MHKRFGTLSAVDGVSFKVRKGEVFGLLGPNGAGKSTIMNMLLGLIPPSSGKALVNGIDMARRPELAKKEIGAVPQETVIETELTAEQNLRLFGRLYGIPESQLQQKIEDALQASGLTEFRNAYAGTFSGGMKRRLETVRGMMHTPQLLLLDEPTIGLDIQNRKKIWGMLRNINKSKKVTILLTTQYLEEADRMCDRFAIIDHGRLIAIGTRSELKEKLGISSVIDVSASTEVLPKVAAAFKSAGLNPQVLENKVVSIGKGATLKKLQKLSSLLDARGISVHSISMHDPTIEDVFLKLTGSNIRNKTGASSKGDVKLFMGGN